MKTLHISTYKTLFIAFCTVFALTGCSDDQPAVPVVPGVQPEIINNMDTPPLLVDGRRMLDKNSVPRYEGIGLSITPTTTAGTKAA